jgi:enterochelin esterase-like enzyme
MKKEKYNWQRSKQETEKYWTDLISKHLVGRTITKVEYIGDEEMEESMWYKKPIAICLDGKDWLIPMSDDEGNDGGSISTTFKELRTIPVIY